MVRLICSRRALNQHMSMSPEPAASSAPASPAQFIELAKSRSTPLLATRSWSHLQLQRYCFSSSSWSPDAMGDVRVAVQIAGTSRMHRRLGGHHESDLRAPGHISIIPSGDTSSFAWDGDMDVVLAFIPQRSIAEVAGIDPDANLDGIAINAPLAAKDIFITQTIISLLDQPTGPFEAILADAATRHLSAHLLSRYCDALPRQQYKGGLSRRQLRTVVDWIKSDHGRTPTISDLSEVAGLSPSHFCRAFKVSTGLAPHQFLMKERAIYAKALLKAARLPISEIARLCGFSDQGNFSRFFKSECGVAPAAFRRGHRT